MGQAMNEREMQWAKLLFNFMAFEAASSESVAHPAGFEECAERIREIGPPHIWSTGGDGGYGDKPIEQRDLNAFSFCYECLKKIRDNFIHGNKSLRTDDPDRLNNLLTWAEDFVDRVNGGGDVFADRVKEIKRAVGIESF